MKPPRNLYELPKDLPAPQDDGACAHLEGMRIPSVPLMSTRGETVDIAARSAVGSRTIASPQS